MSRYDYVVMQAWEYGRIPALKAANPNLKVLVYKNLPSTSSNAVRNGVDDALLPAGVGYAYANASHPDWFALDTNGQRIEWSDYPGNWQMDPANQGYGDQWLANVKSELKRNGWDGVMMDDAATGESIGYHLGGRTMAKYPTAASYTAAVRSFLARVCPPLRTAGFIVLPNISSTTPETWSDWISLCSGAMQEFWTKWGTSNSQQFSGDYWEYRQQFLSLTQQAGRIFLGVTYAPMSDVRSMRYARASFLLDWDGGSSALAFEPEGSGQDPYSAEWAVNIGSPLAPRFKVGVAWRRNYTGGTVVVNPSATTAQTVALGAAYVAPDGTRMSSVTLQPVTGTVLRSDGTAAGSPPPPPPSAGSPPPPPAASPPPPPPAPTKKPGPKPRKTPRAEILLSGAAAGAAPLSVTLTYSGRLRGRAVVQWNSGFAPVTLPLGHLRVTVLHATRHGWRVFAHTRTNGVGAFRVSTRVPATHRPLHFRAVARLGALVRTSGVVVVTR